MGRIQKIALKILEIRDNNLTQYMKVENGEHMLILDRNYDKIIVNCVLPLKIDMIIPFKPFNGLELNMYGNFEIYNMVVSEAHMMFWHGNWWDRSTRK